MGGYNTDSKIEYLSLMLAKCIWQLTHVSKQEDKQVCFIAGVQRSGTNMLMDVLERSMETDVYHEHDKRAFDRYEMLEPDIIKKLLKKSKAKHFIIKALCELQILPDLLNTFQYSKVLWAFRHYEDVVNSMLISFPSQSDVVKRVAVDRNSNRWVGKGMSDSTHELVNSLVHDEIDDASAAALIWYFRNILYFEHQLDAEQRVRLVKYETLVTRPEETLSEVFKFVGVTYNPWVRKKIVANSIRRRPAPTIEPAIKNHCDNLLIKLNICPANIVKND